MTRLHIDQPLHVGERLSLPESAFRHAVQVLRLREGENLWLFNGDGYDYAAVLATVAKREAQVVIRERTAVTTETPLRITLAQGVSKGERMDWAIQKAVELGVSAIAPLITERCNVKLDAERWDKKFEHWRGVVVSACEQSGRARVPELCAPEALQNRLSRPRETPALVLDPRASEYLSRIELSGPALELMIGPEGGLSETEVAATAAAGYRRVRLGPRTLRTETAAVAALAVLQARFGDF